MLTSLNVRAGGFAIFLIMKTNVVCKSAYSQLTFIYFIVVARCSLCPSFASQRRWQLQLESDVFSHRGVAFPILICLIQLGLTTYLSTLASLASLSIISLLSTVV